jgi:hypothetical protein
MTNTNVGALYMLNLVLFKRRNTVRNSNLAEPVSQKVRLSRARRQGGAMFPVVQNRMGLPLDYPNVFGY